MFLFLVWFARRPRLRREESRRASVTDELVLSKAIGHGSYYPRSAAREAQRRGAMLSGNILRMPAGLGGYIPVSIETTHIRALFLLPDLRARVIKVNTVTTYPALPPILRHVLCMRCVHKNMYQFFLSACGSALRIDACTMCTQSPQNCSPSPRSWTFGIFFRDLSVHDLHQPKRPFRSGFFVDGEVSQRDEVCAAVAALKRAAEQFGELFAYRYGFVCGTAV